MALTLVLGGNGRTARRVTAQLRARRLPVRVASRSSPQRFDWYDPTTWRSALDGVRSVYVVPLANPDAISHIAAFGEMAARAGVDRLVLLSGRGVDVAGHESAVFRAALAVEEAIRHCGTNWTILRPTWFAQNFSENFLLHGVLAGELRVPAGSGAEPFVDADDIAAVAVAALTEDGHATEVYELSGPRSLTFEAAVAHIARAAGRHIRYVPLSPEDHVAELVDHGLRREEAVALGELFAVIRRGLSEHLSDGVQRVLGRQPRAFDDYVECTAATGAWSS